LKDIIEQSDSPDTEVIEVGEEKTQISLKDYQALYHRITGRTEAIRKRYKENLLIDFQELEQIHFKIMQLCEIYNVVASNETITVFHEKERKEQFTSFDRFRAYNMGTASPTVNVVMKYNFSIVSNGVQKSQQPQEYVVTANLSSRVAILSEAAGEAPTFLSSAFFPLFSHRAAEISVQYVDYVIARGFLEAFDEWVSGCKSIPENPWLNRMKRWSHLVPGAISLFIVFIAIFFGVRSLPELLPSEANLQDFARFILVYFGAIYSLAVLGNAAGSYVERALDSYPVMSYLKLNKGDDALIDKFRSGQKSIGLRFVAGSLVTIFLGILATKIERLM